MRPGFRNLFPLVAVILLLHSGKALPHAALSNEACNTVTTGQPNEVHVSIPEVVINEYANNSDDLAFMTGLHNDFGSRLGGITSANILVGYEIEPNIALLSDQQGVCAKPALKLTVGYSTLSVYMNIEIPRNSCLYNSIFSHEMHHVAIYKNYLADNIDRIRKMVDEKFNGRAYAFSTLFEAKQYVEILGEVFSQQMRERLSREVNLLQSALDTQTEYTRIQLECAPSGHY